MTAAADRSAFHRGRIRRTCACLAFAIPVVLTGCGSGQGSPSPSVLSNPSASPSISASPLLSNTLSPTPTPSPTVSPTPSCAAANLASGHFGPGPQLLTGGGYDSATLLPNGHVLFLGGSASGRAEIYDPCTNQFTWTGAMHDVRTGGITFTLPDGRVLVYGGALIGCCTTPIYSMEMYDPGTGLFASLGTSLPNEYQYATLLSNGRILFAQGDPASGPAAGLYDPTTGHWQAATNALACAVCWNGRATLLSDGTSVLFAGGDGGTAIGMKTAEIYHYDATGGTFTATGSMSTGRRGPTAIRLSDGNVLILGGESSTGVTNTAEAYDPGSGSFHTVGSMNKPRQYAAATLLPNGDVLVAGGTDGTGTDFASAELYDPATGNFTATGSMNAARNGATATLLSTGLVLITGGSNSTGAVNPELYQP